MNARGGFRPGMGATWLFSRPGPPRWIRVRAIALHDKLEAAGIDPYQWPWPTTTADGARQQAEHAAERDRLGYDWWIADLEERWARKQTGARGGRPVGSGVLIESLDEIRAAIAAERGAKGKVTEDRIAVRLRVGTTTLRNSLTRLGSTWDAVKREPPATDE